MKGSFKERLASLPEDRHREYAESERLTALEEKTLQELYKDFQVPLSDLRKEWKRANFCQRNNLEDTSPEDAIKILALEHKVKYLEKKLGIKHEEDERSRLFWKVFEDTWKENKDTQGDI